MITKYKVGDIVEYTWNNYNFIVKIIRVNNNYGYYDSIILENDNYPDYKYNIGESISLYSQNHHTINLATNYTRLQKLENI